jgi:hypothetical protein
MCAECCFYVDDLVRFLSLFDNIQSLSTWHVHNLKHWTLIWTGVCAGIPCLKWYWILQVCFMNMCSFVSYSHIFSQLWKKKFLLNAYYGGPLQVHCFGIGDSTTHLCMQNVKSVKQLQGWVQAIFWSNLVSSIYEYFPQSRLHECIMEVVMCLPIITFYVSWQTEFL